MSAASAGTRKTSREVRSSSLSPPWAAGKKVGARGCHWEVSRWAGRMHPTPAFLVRLGGARSCFQNLFGMWLWPRKLPSGVSVTLKSFNILINSRKKYSHIHHCLLGSFKTLFNVKPLVTWSPSAGPLPLSYPKE